MICGMAASICGMAASVLVVAEPERADLLREADERHAAEQRDRLLMADGCQTCGAHHEAARNASDRLRRMRRRLLLRLRAREIQCFSK